MTLGGLALAVGILVDEATVEVENIHSQMPRFKTMALAVIAGNQLTAVPRFLAMLCVLAAFLSAIFLQGAAQALFLPMALAVAFSMIFSYLLSSTLVPVLSAYLLKGRHEQPHHAPYWYLGMLALGLRLRLLMVPSMLALVWERIFSPRWTTANFSSACAHQREPELRKQRPSCRKPCAGSTKTPARGM
jgi:multidrug efflux pump subunit AcrB